MKRLQFRHHEEVFANKDAALEYFANIVNPNRIESSGFGETLYAEPLVAKYLDDESNTQVLFAIGVDSGHTPYHIIDSAEIIKNIIANGEAINGEIERATTVEEGLAESIEEIEEIVSGNVTSIVSVTPSSSNVLEEYVLQNAKGEVLGEHIKIYKDSSLVTALLGYKDAIGVRKNEETGKYELIYTGGTTGDMDYLYLVYRDEDDNLQLVGIDLEDFIVENEFKDGLQVNAEDHTVSVKIDGTGESFLTVSPDGVKLNGVQDAINTAEQNAKNYTDASVGTEATARESADNALNSAINNAIDECKTYTTSAYTLSVNYTNDKISELSANTEAAIADAAGNSDAHAQEYANAAEQNAKGYADTFKITALPVESGSTLAARYQLDKGDGVPMGVVIEIPRETALKNVVVGHDGDNVDPHTGEIIWGPGTGPAYILVIYMDSDGIYKMARIAITELLSSLIFGEGLQYNEITGEVSIKIHALEQFLKSDENGLYTSGISEAITDAKNEAQAIASAYTDSQISALRTHVDDIDRQLETRIANNEENIRSLHSSFDNLETLVNSISTKVEGIDALSASTIENAENIAVLSASVVDNYATSADTVDAINEITDRVFDAISGLSADVITYVDTVISGETYAREAADNELSNRIDGLSNRVTALESQISGINDTLSEIQTAIQEINDKLSPSGLVQTLMSILSGTPEEIKVTEDTTNNKVIIGFTDDAVFGQ